MRGTRFVQSIALAFVAAAAVAGSAKAGSVSYEFSSGVQGWRVVGNPAGPLTWESTGGNPGGYVRVVDADSGATEGTAFLVAPAGTAELDQVGGNLAFDLRSSLPDGAQVIVQSITDGESFTVSCYRSTLSQSWTTFSVSIRGDEACWANLSGGFSDATDEDLEAAFGGDDATIFVYADYDESAGEVVDLDNFVIQAPARVSRDVSIAYSRKAEAFKGRVSSSNPEGDVCVQGVEVELYEERGENDKFLLGGTTTAVGRYRFERKAAKGKKYYVLAPLVTSGIGCDEKKSKAIKPVR